MAPDGTSGGGPSEGPTPDPKATDAERLRAEREAEARAEAKVAAQPTPPVEPDDDEVQDTSGRPDLAEVAQERVENRNPRVVETAQEEE